MKPPTTIDATTTQTPSTRRRWCPACATSSDEAIGPPGRGASRRRGGGGGGACVGCDDKTWLVVTLMVFSNPLMGRATFSSSDCLARARFQIDMLRV
jgi:hypothetical protein